MTSQVARLYAVVTGIVAFFLAWATVAAHPWAAPQPVRSARDPQVVALAARQQRIQAESVRVKRIVDARWAAYRHQLAARNSAVAAAAVVSSAQPSVRVVNLPPLVVTRTS